MEFTTRFELQSQTTRLLENAPYVAGHRPQTGLSPSMMTLSRVLIPAQPLAALLHATTRHGAKHADSRLELLPLHSQLLGESLLVSFPPLIYMLKFSGSSYLN